MIMLNVNPNVVNKSYKAAIEARNFMLHYKQGKFYSKVYYLCDHEASFLERFI